MFKLILLSASVLFCLSSSVMAGTVIQIKDNDDITTMMTDGKRARINMSADEYVIVDFSSNEVNVITSSQKQIMSFNAGSIANASGENSSLVNLNLRQLGAGGVIAGYQTQKYQYSANGRSCGTVYASQNAYQENGIKELLQVMQIMIEQQRALLGGFASLVDDCTLADMQLTDKVSVIGVPMRTEENGQVGTQITSIRLNVALPDNAFTIPENYTGKGMTGKKRSGSTRIQRSAPMPQAQPGRPVQRYQRPVY